jgi:putative glutathione S-transferase
MTATAPRYASPIDAFAFGEHDPGPAARGQVRRFTGRLSADGATGYLAEPGRYHLYGGWFCPRSHRAALVRMLAGLTGQVSISYVDQLRDARGWAFRARTGPDPVNGFTLLREAYLATDPGFTSTATVPVLWDRRTRGIVSNDPDTIDVDLAVAFGDRAALYPVHARAGIDRSFAETAALSATITRAVYTAPARDELHARLRDLDRRLADGGHLVGAALTLADIRLWVVLARFDAGANATGAAGAPLTSYPALWRYARSLYRLPAFRETTDFTSFKAPLTPLADWDAPLD